MKKVERATRLLERLRSYGVSQAGLDWLTAVMDPCHDEKLTCEGYPDDNIGPSVVQVIKQSYDVAIPSTYTVTDTWGCHIWLDDYLLDDIAETSNSVIVENNSVIMDETATVSKQLLVGGLNGVSFDQTVHGTTDVTNLPPVSAGAKNTPTFGPLLSAPTNINGSFLQGKIRKIGEAFEVCNTTAELYRGGSVLCYEQPSTKNEPTSYLFTVTTATLDPVIVKKYGKENIYIEHPKLIVEDAVQAIPHEFETMEEEEKGRCILKKKEEDRYTSKRFFVIGKSGQKEYLDQYVSPVVRTTVRSMSIDNTPPISLSEAMILPGTQQWGAEEGVYLVQSMNTLVNPPSFPNTMGSIYTPDELTWPSATSNPDTSVNLALVSFPTVDTTYNMDNFNNNFKTPFNKKGCIFSGLTPQTTLKVNRTLIIERFISSSDPNLATLAKMSPCRDEMALKIYTEVMRTLPIGAKFKDNGLGDWFMGCVDSVVDWVADIGKPIMGAVSGYQTARRGGAPVASAPVVVQAKAKPQKALKQQQKAVGAGKLKKKGLVEGPRLPNNAFKSQQAKAAKQIKKSNK